MNNASQYIVLIVYSLLLVALLAFAFFILLAMHKHKTYSYQMRLLEAKRHYEQELMKIKIELQEHALTMISAEIHDNIGQVLSSVSMALQSIDTSPVPHITSVIDSSAERVNNAIGELRNLAHTLNGARVEKLGLVQSIKRELAFLKFNKNLQVRFNYPVQQIPELSGPQTLLLFRIAQEAIHNVTRHANASILEITLLYEAAEKKISLAIMDNGVGILEPVSQSGIGIITMQQRAILLNGTFKIDTAPERGSTITVNVNL